MRQVRRGDSALSRCRCHATGMRVTVVACVVGVALLFPVSGYAGSPVPDRGRGPALSPWSEPVAVTDTGSQDAVLVLYDAAQPYAWLGELYATQLANLLGHFPVEVKVLPVGAYETGMVEAHRATFYIGSVFENPLPEAFQADVQAATRPVCWLKYNLWQIAWTVRLWRAPPPPSPAIVPRPVARAVPAPTVLGPSSRPVMVARPPAPVPQQQRVPDPRFEAQYGFRFAGLDQSGYTVVRYHGVDFDRHPLDPETGHIIVHDPERVTVYADLRHPATGAQAPYVIQSGSLWYVSDIPFTFTTETDRYLVFADLLHDIIGVDHHAPPRALVRLEDIDPVFPPDRLQAVTDYLEGAGVPFGLSVIPRYVDPQGVYNEGVAEEVHLSDAPVLPLLQAVAGRGAPVFLHGFTHQYRNLLNPITGVTGDDFEFFRVTLNPDLTLDYQGPVGEDSANWARARVRDGTRELRRAGLTAFGWETPHYAASVTDYTVFANAYPTAAERILVFSEPLQSAAAIESARQQVSATLSGLTRLGGRARGGTPQVFGVTSPGPEAPRAFLGQFFPYPIQRDVYGRRLLPENLGHVDPDGWLAFPPRFPVDLLDAAARNLALREPWAAFYFHPYLDLALLQEVVEGLRELGYEFVNGTAVFAAGFGATESAVSVSAATDLPLLSRPRSGKP